MQKEIFEQPAVIGDTLHALINPATRTVHLPDLPFALGEIERDHDLRLRHRAIMPAWSPNTGSSGSPASRSRSTSPRSSATARRRCRAAAPRSSSRNRARPPTRWRRCAMPGRRAEDHRDRQPAGKLDRARGRHRAADPGRAGDRRRLDQGVHHPARRACRLYRGDGAGARRDRRSRARPSSSAR